MSYSLDELWDTLSNKMPELFKTDFEEAWTKMGLRKGSQYQWSTIQQKADKYKGERDNLITAFINSDEPSKLFIFIFTIHLQLNFHD